MVKSSRRGKNKMRKFIVSPPPFSGQGLGTRSSVAPLPYSKTLVLVIEDDSHISRLLRNHFEKAFPSVRVEIAGSPAKAQMICERFKPNVLVWDGEPNERGTREQYAACIPDHFWKRVIPISTVPESQAYAQSKGALPPLPKPEESLNAWAAQVTVAAKAILAPPKSGKR